jgi:hypothetical protein
VAAGLARLDEPQPLDAGERRLRVGERIATADAAECYAGLKESFLPVSQLSHNMTTV